MNGSFAKFVISLVLLQPGWAMKPMSWDSLMVMKAAAEKGNREAQFLFGVQVMVGDGLARDRVEAVKWLRQAAEAGHVEAQYTLGNLYATPDPTDGLSDPAAAEQWLTMAAAQGNREAIARLNDEEEKRLRSAAENGDPAAIARLEAFLEKTPIKRRYNTPEQQLPVAAALPGKESTVDAGDIPMGSRAADWSSAKPREMDEDPAVTIRWSLLLSGLRGADAHLVRGFMLENSIVVNRDFVAAAASYRQAAGQGDARAQYRLGLMYAEGRGVAKDLVEANTWLSRAAGQGSAEATEALAKFKVNLPPASTK